MITLLLLVAMLVGVRINYIYINEVCDEIYARLEVLPDMEDPECVEETRALLEYWEEQVESVEFSVGHVAADRISEQAATLLACAECGNLYGYRTAIALLRDAVGDMRRIESLSFENIL